MNQADSNATPARPSFLPADRPWPPRRVQPAAHHDGAIEIVGDLAQDAELRLGAKAGSAVLVFTVETGLGFPYEVIQPYSADPADLQAATVLQRALRRGASVRVTAHGCLPRTDHGHAVLQLLEVTHITTP